MQCDEERSEDILRYEEFRLKGIEPNVLCVTCYVLCAVRLGSSTDNYFL